MSLIKRISRLNLAISSRQNDIFGESLFSIDYLGHDLLLYILRWLDGSELCILSQVSKEFDFLINKYEDQILWRELFEREWPGRKKPKTKTWKYVYWVCLESELILSDPSNSFRPICTEYRVLVLGDRKTGKTNLITRFVNNYYTEHHKLSSEETYRLNLTIDQRFCSLELNSWTGMNQYRPLDEQYLLSATGIIFVYSICDRSSFENITSFRDYAFRAKAVDNLPILLVGTMNDRNVDRMVSRKEGQELARAMWCPFIEVSAKINRNVNQAHVRMIREIRKHHFRIKSPSIAHYNLTSQNRKKICACNIM
eukprot:gb/GECH01000508.1/.p1 GENE.gb/GECH01000508.1/~~gb/GECH01000508.1/.p1  ORF type:complete len:311 (+),score=48.49 gb/GECH01000508.1/:1-933(+)